MKEPNKAANRKRLLPRPILLALTALLFTYCENPAVISPPAPGRAGPQPQTVETTPDGSTITTTWDAARTKIIARTLDVSPSITSIRDRAYYKEGLTGVSLPPSVKSIGKEAFAQNSLTTLTIPETVKSLGDSAFAGNGDIKQVTISQYLLNRAAPNAFPDNVTFKDQAGTAIAVETKEVKSKDPQGSDIIEKRNKVTGRVISRSLTVSSSLTAVDADTYKNKKLIALTIPRSVKSIGAGAFSGNNLTAVIIPDSVTSLGDLAFAGNKNLKEVIITQALLDKTPVNAFSSNPTFKNHSRDVITRKALVETTATVDGSVITTTKNADGTVISKSLAVSSALTAVANNAYEDLGLTAVTIPPSVTSIGASAFLNNQLTTVTIPTGVISLGDSAFAGNSTLSEVIITQFRLNRTPANVFPSNPIFKDHSGNVITQQSFDETTFIADGSTITTTRNGEGTILSKSLAVSSSLTAIPDNAYENLGLTSVTIASSITSIGASAFRNNRLTSVAIPTRVISLGDSAFAGNSSLTEIILSQELFRSIAGSAFPRSAAFKNHNGNQMEKAEHGAVITTWKDSSGKVTSRELFIPPAVTSIRDNAFSLKSLTSVSIPPSVTSIGNHAFSWNRLTSVRIPPSVTSIGNHAFSWNSLTSVSIPSSVTSIGDYAFSGNALTQVTIPAKVTSLGALAFALNDTLNEVIIRQYLLNRTPVNVFPSNPIFKDHSGNVIARQPIVETETTDDGSTITTTRNAEGTILSRSLAVSSSLTSIADNAYKNLGLTSVTIPSKITSIGTSAFAGNRSLTEITLSHALLGSTAAGVFPASAAFRNDEGNQMEKAAHGAVITTRKDSSGTVTSRELFIPSSVTSIEAWAFSSKRLMTVSIPSSVTSIGAAAFEYNRLTTVTIPTAVTSLGASAFAGNRNLKEVIITQYRLNRTPENVFPSNPTFKDHSGNVITRQSIVETETTDDGSIITTTRNAEGTILSRSLAVSSSLTSIADNAYKNLGLTSVTIPSKITSIGTSAFAGNRSLTEITLSRALLISAPAGAFPPSAAFRNHEGNQMERAEHGAVITTRKDSLGTVTGRELFIPSSVTSIEDWAFSDKGLTAVSIPANVTSIGFMAFTDNRLTKVTIPAKVTSLGDSAFAGNMNLKEVIITQYRLNRTLENVFPSDPTFKDHSGNVITRKPIVETETTADGSTITTTKNAEGRILSKSLAVSSSLKAIADDAYMNSSLTSVTIPSSVTAIGVAAFRNNRLMTVTIPTAVTSLGDSAFADNRNLKEVIITQYRLNRTPENVFPSNPTFKDHSGNVITRQPIVETTTDADGSTITTTKNAEGRILSKSLAVSSSITAIPNNAYKNLGLTSVTIPSPVTSVGASAFAGNSGLTEITLSRALLGSTAAGVFPASASFRNDEGNQMEKAAHGAVITTRKDSSGTVTGRELFIPSSVTSIEDWAFSDKGLTAVSIPSSVTAIGEGAFSFNKLTAVTIPPSVTSIELAAFSFNRLTTVVIPPSVNSIKDYAFSDNSSLRSVTITQALLDETSSDAFPAEVTFKDHSGETITR